MPKSKNTRKKAYRPRQVKIMAELDRTYRALGSTLANEHLGFYWLNEEKEGKNQKVQK